MQQYTLKNPPIVYYMSRAENTKWVLFLHAAFVNHTMFKTQIAYFRDKYNLLTLDMIGHGNSMNVQKGDSIGKMAEWINEILKKENIDKIHIVGVSMGAILAQDFANRFPQSVQSLACFGGYDINHLDTKIKKKQCGTDADDAQSNSFCKMVCKVKQENICLYKTSAKRFL